MVVYLDSFWKIGVSAKVWCENIPELTQLIHVPIYVSPQCVKLVIVQEEMDGFILRILALTTDIVESDKLTVTIKNLWVYLWNVGLNFRMPYWFLYLPYHFLS